MLGIFLMLFAFISIGAGIACTVVGMKEQFSCKTKTIGKVVDMKETRYSGENVGVTNAHISYFPVIEFLDGERATPKNGQNPPKYQIGDEVEIYYNPNDHSSIRLKGLSLSIVIGIPFVLLGGVLFIAGLLVFVISVSF